MPARPFWRHPLLWLLLTFLALAVANSFTLPSFESMDEPRHFNVMRYVADYHRLPDQRDVATAIKYNYYQEGGQPPLYYVLGALALEVLDEDVSDVGELTTPNPLSTCGDVSQPYSKGLWMRNPQREEWPFRGAALGLHVVRLFSAALGIVTVSGVYLTAKTTFPTVRGVGLVAAALVAFSPRFLVHSAAVTNDTLLVALCAVGVYLAADTLRRGPSLTRSLALGAVSGLAVLSKMSGVFLLPLAGLVLIDRAWREKAWARNLRHLALVGLLALVIGGWWYLGNLLRYGDPGVVPLVTQDTGLRAAWPARLILPEIGKFYRTYWASAYYCRLQLGFFPLYGALSALGGVGLVVALWRAKGHARPGPALLATWTAVVFAAWFSFNSVVYAPHGRFLFQAHAGIGPLMAVGLLTLIGRWPHVWRGLVLGLGAMAFITPVGILGPMFNPPVRTAAEAVTAPYPLEATFGDRVQLLGYDIAADGPAGEATARAGQKLDVTVYLAAAQPIAENYALGLQLKSLAAADDAVLVNFRNWPGGGNLPTTAWRPGEAFADRYELQIPVDVPQLQLWELRLMFFRYPRLEGSDDRLPVRVGGVAGGPYVVLEQVRVEPLTMESPPVGAVLKPPPAFGPAREVTLQAAEIARSADGANLRVALWWHAAEPLNGEYTVFVHLLGSGDHVWASGDGLPRAGAMPTRYWRSGDLIIDEHRLQLPDDLPPGRYDVSVGLYGISQRLPAWDGAGGRLPQNAATVAQWEHEGT